MKIIKYIKIKFKKLERNFNKYQNILKMKKI